MIYTPQSLANYKKVTRIIDVNHNNPVTEESLDGSGIVGVIYKINQGDYPDPARQDHHDLLSRLNLLEGGYGFSEPGPGAPQAEFLLDGVTDIFGGNDVPFPEFVMALDLEPDEKLGKMTVPQAEDYVQCIADNTGYWPLLYGGGGLLRDAFEMSNRYAHSKLLNCNLWLADYRKAWRVITGWDRFSLLQWAQDDENPGWDYNAMFVPPDFTGDPIDFIKQQWPLLMNSAK